MNSTNKAPASGSSRTAGKSTTASKSGLSSPKVHAERLQRYMEKAVASECAKLAACTAGRNTAASSAAFAMGSLVPCGLDRTTAEEDLWQACEANGLAKDEPSKTRDTLKRGLDRGALKPRKLPAPKTREVPTAKASKVPPPKPDEAPTPEPGEVPNAKPGEVSIAKLGKVAIAKLDDAPAPNAVKAPIIKVVNVAELTAAIKRDMVANPVAGVEPWRSTWDAAGSDTGRAADYLRFRGLSGVVPPAWRFNGALAYKEKKPMDLGDSPAALGHSNEEYVHVGDFPAVIMPLVQADGHQSGIHRLYLSADGPGKAPVSDAKKGWGEKRGAYIPIGGDETTADMLHLTEGPETALAVFETIGGLTRAAVDAGNLLHQVPPAHCKGVCFWADHDAAGLKHALSAAAPWFAAGMTVHVLIPPVKDADWLDMLVDPAYGPTVLRAAFADAKPWTPPLPVWMLERNKADDVVRAKVVELGARDCYIREHTALFDPGEDSFFEYDAATGLWLCVSEATMRDTLGVLLLREGPEEARKFVQVAVTHGPLSNICQHLKGRMERRDAFQRDRPFVHCTNGILDLSGAEPVLRPFSPEWHSRNAAPFAYDPQAACPQWREALAQAVSPEDADLFQRYAGSTLLTGNQAQRIMMLLGLGGSGKSQFAAVISGMIGMDNVSEFVTNKLDDKFTLFGFVGKTLLLGVDVPADFMQQSGAGALKRLTGGDGMDVEAKFSNERAHIRGDFDCLIYSNSRLAVRLEGDESAWQRRLMVIEFNHEPVRRMVDFALHLLRTEGAGILAWAVEGAICHLAELADGGDFRSTPAQKQRVDSLILESRGLDVFFDKCVVESENDVTTAEVVSAYFDFATTHGWTRPNARFVENRLPDLFLECFGKHKRNDILRGGKGQRGFGGVTLVPVRAPVPDAQPAEQPATQVPPPAADAPDGLSPLLHTGERKMEEF